MIITKHRIQLIFTHQHSYDESGSCYVCDHNIYFDYSISNEEVTITGYLTDKSTITIPSHIEFLPVKHIANNAFEGCTVIENIKLSNSITSIGEKAFSNCTSIANIDIPDSVISKWAKTAVYTCQQADIVNGKGANTFDPQGTGTRAEASVIFSKFHKDYLVK